MPLVKLTKGHRYQFENVLVENGEVIDVDNRTRNRLVRSGHFIDVAEEDRPAFVAMPEDDQDYEDDGKTRAPSKVTGGRSLDDLDDPAITGSKEKPSPKPKPQGARGRTKVHSRSGSDKVNARARKSAAELIDTGAEAAEASAAEADEAEGDPAEDPAEQQHEEVGV